MANLVLRPSLDLLRPLVRPLVSLVVNISVIAQALQSQKRFPAHHFIETLKVFMVGKKPTRDRVHPHLL